MTKPPANEKLFWLTAAAVVLFVYFFGLTIPLLGPDEPRYAQVAREMFERGDWITPTLGRFNWFEKPALLYWLQIAAYNVFGVSEFSARFGSTLFGVGTIVALWLLGKNFATENQETAAEDTAAKENSVSSVAKDFPFWLVLIAASSLGLIVFSRGASFDIILTFPITAAMVSFFIFDRTVSASPRLRVPPSLVIFYFFVGLALLAKGLVGAVFPFAIIAFYFLLSRQLPNKTFLLSLLWGGVITLAVAAVWYVPMYQRHGWTFIDEFFIQHHFQRYTSNKYFHPQPFYFFLWVLPLMTLPWLPFFFTGFWTSIKGFFQHRDAETRRYLESKDINKIKNAESRVGQSRSLLHSTTPLLLYSSAWLLVPLVFFSFSGSKLPGYILPALPPALILTTFGVVRFIDRNEFRKRMVQAIAITTFLVVTALLIFVVPRFADTDSVKRLIAAANERGFTSEKVITLYTVSHNAEFYAEGRLFRDASGKQRQLNTTGELVAALKRESAASALVIYPLALQRHLLESREVRSEAIADNGEHGIAIVRPEENTIALPPAQAGP